MAFSSEEQELSYELMSPDHTTSISDTDEVRQIFEELLDQVEQQGGSSTLGGAANYNYPSPSVPTGSVSGIGGASNYQSTFATYNRNQLAVKVEGEGGLQPPTFGMVLSPTANNSLRTSASITQSTPTLLAAAAARPEVKHSIERIVVEMDALFGELERLHQFQSEFLFNGGPQLGDLHVRLLARIDAAASQLANLLDVAPLLPAELQRRDDMSLAAEILRRRVQLYQAEYERKTRNPIDRNPTASLMIVKQPFPCLVLQQQQLIPESLEVQLFSGVEQSLLDGGEVEAILQGETINSGGRAKKRKAHLGTPVEPTAKMLENQTHKMFKNICSMPIKFLLSSEKKIQFAPCEGELLKKEVFEGNIMPVPWPKIANCLQRQFSRTIRQAERSDEAPRPLSMLDICYIHQKRFDGGARVSINNFDKFWAWYGKFLHMFRYQRHIAKMWLRGLIFPFIGRETAEYLLGNKPGTFLLRPSDAFPGQLVISYISPMGQVQHYLVSHSDVTPKSLASFILEKNLLSQVLQFDFKGLETAWTALADGMGGLHEVPEASSLSVNVVAKTAVFSEFVRPRTKGGAEKEEDEEAWRYQRDPSILSGGSGGSSGSRSTGGDSNTLH